MNYPMSKIPLLRIHNINAIQLDQIDRPHAGPDDLVMQVAQCGICGSDLGFIAMGGLLGPGNPMALGHELSGTVIEAGANVHHVAVGDRVVINPEGNGNRIGCSGADVGGFSPYLLVRGAALDPQVALKLPESLSFEQGALVEPLSVAMHAVHQGQAKSTDRVVIFGAGPIGLGILLVLQYYGVKNIVVVDLAEFRLAKVAQLGGIPVKADSTDLANDISGIHGQESLMGRSVPATDLYFEATGVEAVFEQCVKFAKSGARVVVVGVHKKPVKFDLVNLLMRELTITGSMAYPKEFPQVIDMLASGKIDTAALISHRFALSDFQCAFDTARDTQQAIKVLVDCQA